MKKILDFLTGTVIKEIGQVIDNLFTTDEERIEAKNKIFQVIQEKELELQKMQTDIIIAEAKGNWLQRSWRPILMLSFWVYSYICKVLSTFVWLYYSTIRE